jgi:hypothetical protein
MAMVGGQRRFLEPLRSDADRELYLHLAALELAGRRVASIEQDAKQRADDAARYTCAVCARVVAPSGTGDGAIPRQVLVDGHITRAKLCLGCHALATDRAMRRREGVKRGDGRTLGQAADELVAALAKAAAS